MINYDNPTPLEPKQSAADTSTVNETRRVDQEIDSLRRQVSQLENDVRRLRNDLRSAVNAFNLSKNNNER